MRFVLTAILLLLAALAAGAISRFVPTVLAFALALVVFLGAFGVGVFMILVGWLDESLGQKGIGCLLILSAVVGARRLWTRSRYEPDRRS